MSKKTEDAIEEIEKISEKYGNISGTHQEYMSIHSLSQRLHSNIMSLAVDLMEIDKKYIYYYKAYIINIRKDTEGYLDNKIFSAFNRAESKAKAEHIELKAEYIEYERLYNRLKFYIQMASELAQDMRSFISSLKKERNYEQYTNYQT